MTYGEIAEYAKSQLFKLVEPDIDDYRPAGDIYIDDIAFPVEYEGKGYVSIPNGIRFWLTNGDSIIYVTNKKNDMRPDVKKERIDIKAAKEKRKKIKELRELGLKFREIGILYGVSAQRARELYVKALSDEE